DRASEAFEHAFALGAQVNDACWEAYGVRGLGLLHAAKGDLGTAIQTIDDALSRCARQRDTHLWLRAYVLDALCAVAVADGHPSAERWVSDLSALARGCVRSSRGPTSTGATSATPRPSRWRACSRSAWRTPVSSSSSIPRAHRCSRTCSEKAHARRTRRATRCEAPAGSRLRSWARPVRGRPTLPAGLARPPPLADGAARGGSR